jgi:hypothetical protein
MSELDMDDQQGGSHPTPADRHKESIPPDKDVESTDHEQRSTAHPTGEAQAAANREEELPA